MIPSPAVLSLDAAPAALAAAVREAHGEDASLESWTGELITRHGRRRVVRFDVRVRVAGGAQARHQWAGKFYEDDHEARMVADVLRTLASSDCAARGGMVIPDVVAYHAPQHLLLLTYEPGESVTPAIARYGGPVLRAIGRALAALHATPVPVKVAATAASVLDQVRPRVAELLERLPREAVGLPRRLHELEREIPPAPAPGVFVHGDFGPAQMLWQQGALVLLDFDRCARGDPALDLGNLMAQLYRLTLRKPGMLPEFATLRGGILDAYRHGSGPDDSLDGRVTWYERATLIRKIHSLVFDTTRHPEPEALERRRAEAIRLLEELR
jgi:aminoglycoside phosphotransferase (APT) family kinase protein